MKKFKLHHFRKNCIGCNACVVHAPKQWVMNEKDGKVDLQNSELRNEAYVADLEEDDVLANEQAACACPMNIIKITKSK